VRGFLLCLSVVLVLVSGCSRPPRYSVYVTGYTGGAPSAIPAGARIAVVENPAARNPLLEQEVVSKARRALAAQGFRAAEPAEADVAVLLTYGTDARLEQSYDAQYVPGQTSTVKDSTGKIIGTVTGDASVAYHPTIATREVPWLTMTALDGRAYRESSPGKPVWIGESKSSGANLPLRSMIDYLLVPAASAFGRNQPQIRTLLRADDMSVAALRGQ
jgi:hypothetical protein